MREKKKLTYERLEIIRQAKGDVLIKELAAAREWLKTQEDTKRIVQLFIDLAACVEEKDDINDILQLLIFLSALRCNLMQIDLFSFSKKIYVRYHDSLCLLRCRVQYLMKPEDMRELSMDNKSYLAHVYFALSDFGADGLALFLNGMFAEGVQVQCPYCQHVQEEVFLLPGEFHKGVLQPYGEKEHPGVYAPYPFFQRYLKRMKEEELSSLLPYIYAKLPCKQCADSFVFMDGLLEHIKFHSSLLSAPSKEELSFLLDHGIALGKEDRLEEALYYLQYARSLSLLLDREDVSLECEILLELAQCWQRKMDEEKALGALRYIVERLDEKKEEPLLLADAYVRMGSILLQDEEKIKEEGVEEILLYFQRASMLYEEEEGSGSRMLEQLQSQIALAYTASDAYRQKGLDMLQEEMEEAYRQEEEETYAQCARRLAIALFTYTAEKKKAAAYYQNYLSWVERTYGSMSDVTADEYSFFVEYLRDSGLKEEALMYAVKAVEINEAYYQKAQRRGDAALELLNFADACLSCAALYMDQKDYEHAVFYYQKSHACRLAVGLENRELGDCLKGMGEAMEALGKSREALQRYREALDVYHKVKQLAFATQDSLLYEEIDACNQAMSSLHRHIKELEER